MVDLTCDGCGIILGTVEKYSNAPKGAFCDNCAQFEYLKGRPKSVEESRIEDVIEIIKILEELVLPIAKTNKGQIEGDIVYFRQLLDRLEQGGKIDD